MFPALVGMNRRSYNQSLSPDYVPRTRGDEP